MTDPKREGQEVDELRNAVRTAWMTGVPDFRQHYDKELFAALGIGSFQDLWPGRTPAASSAANDRGEAGVYEQRLRAVLDAVQDYLPPDGIDVQAAMNRIIAQVDPWPTSPEPSAGGGSDNDIRQMWRAAGGQFFGPNIETGAMPEARLLPFLRSLLAPTPQPADCAADGEPRYAASFGYSLAAEVLQSDLYHKLNDRARGECDELLARGLERAPSPTHTDQPAPTASAKPWAPHDQGWVERPAAPASPHADAEGGVT